MKDVTRKAAPKGERRDTKSVAKTRLAGTSAARMSDTRKSSRASMRPPSRRASSHASVHYKPRLERRVGKGAGVVRVHEVTVEVRLRPQETHSRIATANRA